MKFFQIKRKIIIKLVLLCLVSLGLFFASGVLAVGEDLIGLRVYSNHNHLSPSEWYLANVEYPGSPASIQVDGYEAVQDGRTIYVAATNKNSTDIYYTNIYLISYNESATPETVNIFNQLVNNWYFNTNITSTTTKAQIIRDTKRLADLQNIAESINNYGQSHSYCNISTNISCPNGDDDCPEGQECLGPFYPPLESGSFIIGQSTSKWPSWQQTLAPALSTTLTTDPVNEFLGCTKAPEPPGSGYDPETCWNETINQFTCVQDSKFYYYKSAIPTNYELLANAEIFTSANLDPDSNLDSHININAEAEMCTAVGLGPFCGNGVVECPPDITSPACDICITGGNEQCEPGDTRYYCDIKCGAHNWNQERITGCNNDCTWFDPFLGITACTQTGTPEIWDDFCGGYCNDGFLQGPWEECDPNGTGPAIFIPGWSCAGGGDLLCDGNCQIYCSNNTPPYQGECGNNILEYPEQCETNFTYAAPTPATSSQTNQYECGVSTTECISDGGWCGDDICQGSFGETVLSCSVDCVPAAPTGFSAVADPPDTINLSWNDVEGEIGYKIWRSTSPVIWPDDPTYTLGPNVTSQEDSPLASPQTYYYRLASYNGAGNSPYSLSGGIFLTDAVCGDFVITGSEVCDDGTIGTTGPQGQQGNNGNTGYCNATCTGIQGLGVPLFYDNFENWSSTLSNWEQGYNYGATWIQELILNGTNKLKSVVTNTGYNFPRDFRVINNAVSSKKDVNILVMVNFSQSNDHDAVVFARHQGGYTNSQTYYALWNDFTANGYPPTYIQIKKILNGNVSTNLVSTAAIPNTNDYWWLQFQVYDDTGGVRLKARWWKTTDPMPAANDWTFNVLDNTSPITTAGKVGVAGWKGSTFYYDNFQVYNITGGGGGGSGSD